MMMNNQQLYHLDAAIHQLMWHSLGAAMAANVNNGNARGQMLETFGQNMSAIAQDHLLRLYEAMTGQAWSFKVYKMHDLAALERYYFEELEIEVIA